MALFRRARPPVAAAPVLAHPAFPVGTLACSRHGCPSTSGVQCAYVDRRRHECDTAWCGDHAVLVAGRVYCQRHAGTVRALSDTHEIALPDGDNRAASLVNWMGAELDADVCLLLAPVVAERADVRLIQDQVKLVLYGTDRVRTWQRSWKLAAHVGVASRVEVCVLEEDDDRLVVRVNQKDVLTAVPPWIEARRTGERLSDEEDQARRQGFHAELVEAVRAGLAKARPLI